MAEKKILLKEVYGNLLSDAYVAEKNDKLLPIEEYDVEVVEKIEKLITIDEQDYEVAEEYYKNYLRILDGVIKCKDKRSLKRWKKKIIKDSPWALAVKKSKKSQYRGIADSDRIILMSLLEEEIKIIEKDNRQDLEEIYGEGIAEPAKMFFVSIFRDFEQAFDGNFENPRVIFMGINPKIEKLDHENYDLENRFSKPFNGIRSVLMNKNIDEDYYFKNGGFFFTKSESDEEFRKEFIRRVCEKSEITPFAFWEFYPYATMSQKKWFKEIKIRNRKIKKYFEWRLVLPSQIWLLCLLVYAIKKVQFRKNENLILYCTKKNAKFIKKTMIPLIDILEIDKNKRICILTSKSQNRVFSKGNIKAYPSTVIPKFIKLDSNKEFFASIWGIGNESENIFS